MTEQLITKAENWLKDETGNNCSNLSLKQAAKAMSYFHYHLLQQTKSSTPLEFLEQMLIKEEEVQADENLGVSKGMTVDKNIEAIRRVIDLIKFHPPLA